jgi:hypothetical protein
MRNFKFKIRYIKTKIINFLKTKKGKIMVGKKVKLVCAPSGKEGSSNNCIGSCEEFIIKDDRTNTSWFITDLSGNACGWVFEWEIVNIDVTKEFLENELEVLNQKVSDTQAKLNYLKEIGAETFDENEFKVYTTLKTLENESLSLNEKTKLIAGLIKN